MNIILIEKCSHGKPGDRVFVPLFEANKLIDEGKAREVCVRDIDMMETVSVVDARKALNWQPLNKAPLVRN